MFVAFLSGVTEKVHQLRWNQIMLINVGLTTYNLLVDYRQIGMDNITTDTTTYTSTQTREAQNSEMLYQFQLSSLLSELKNVAALR